MDYSRGAREIAAAKRNVSTARQCAVSLADSLAHARKRLTEILDDVNQCERQVGEANDNLKEAQQYLEDLEKRYVEDIDADVEDETSQKQKRPRLSHGGGGFGNSSNSNGGFEGGNSGFRRGSATTTPPMPFGKITSTAATKASTSLGQPTSGGGFGTAPSSSGGGGFGATAEASSLPSSSSDKADGGSGNGQPASLCANIQENRGELQTLQGELHGQQHQGQHGPNGRESKREKEMKEKEKFLVFTRFVRLLSRILAGQTHLFL